MKKKLSLLVLLALVLGVGLVAQGPLKPLMNLSVRSDASGYLVTTGGNYTAPDGPLTAMANLRGRTDANGYLITTTSPTGASSFYAGNGTAASPSYSWSNFTTSGWYHTSGGGFGLSISTVPYIAYYSDEQQMKSTAKINWSSGAIDATDDLGLSRGAAGILAVGDGSAPGNTTGTVSTGSYLTGANGGMTWTGRSAIGSPANGLFTVAQNSFATVGLQINTGTAAPTLTSCGTGTLTAHSTNMSGEVTPTGASACTVTFGSPNWSFQPFCTVTFETVAESFRISAISVSAFTVTFTTAANKFMYNCSGGAF